MKKRRFEYKGGTSYKFWEIEVTGKTHTVTYGRIGYAGTTLSKRFPSEYTATRDAETLIQQKLNKGYREVYVADSDSLSRIVEASQKVWTKSLTSPPSRKPKRRKVPPVNAQAKSAPRPPPKKPESDVQNRIANLDFDD